ncbi:MAG: phage tail tape measure protein, partial [Candidatus Woesearchaeota archaeon]
MAEYNVTVDIILKLLNDEKVKQSIREITQGVTKLRGAVSETDADMKKFAVTENKAADSSNNLAQSEETLIEKYKRVSSELKQLYAMADRGIKLDDTSKKRIMALTKEYHTMGGSLSQVSSAYKAQEQVMAKQVAMQEKVKLGWQTTNTIMGKGQTELSRTQVKYKLVGDELQKFSRTQTKAGMIGQTLASVTGNQSYLWKTQTITMAGLLKKFTQFRWMMVNITMIIGAAVGIYRTFIQSSVELEKEMANVRKTTNYSREDILNLTDAYIEMSRQLPISAKELAQIGVIAGQLGLGGMGSKAIESFTRTVAMMSVATEMSAEQAATSLAKIIQAFNLTISSANALGSVINELSNTTAATSTEIADSLVRVGAAGENIGLSVEFVAALEATLISAGMKASRAGTRMRNAINMIAADVDNFAELTGQSVEKFRQNLETDAEGALMNVLDALNAYDSSTLRASKTTELFGKIGGFAIQTLSNNYDELSKNVRTAKNEMISGLSLIRETGVQVDTMSGQMGLLKNEWQSMILGEKDWVRGLLSGARAMIAIKSELGKGFFKQTLDTIPMLLFGKNTEEMQSIFDDYFINLQKLAKEANLSDDAIKEMNKDIASYRFITDAVTQTKNYIEELKNKISAEEEASKKLSIYQSKFLDVNDALKKYSELAILVDNVSKKDIETFIEMSTELEYLKEDIKNAFGDDILSYIENFNKAIDETTVITSQLQAVMSLVNKSIGSELKTLNETYNKYRSARFKGEEEQLKKIKDIELALKKEKLAQLQLTDAVSSTNNELKSEQGSYEAWVETVNQFIKSTIENGNLLGKNTSDAVKQYQTLLMSTSRFADETIDKEETLTNELERQGQIEQLKYDIDFGTMHSSVKEAEESFNNLGNVVWSSAEEAISAILSVKKEIESLTEKQDGVTSRYDNMVMGMSLYAAGVENYTELINSNIDTQIAKLDELFAKNEELKTIIKVEEPTS